jgi:predicted permease
VGGLLPFSDASGYHYDARRLLDGHLLGWSARRPLFSGLLATLLGLTGQNLQVVLAILVAMTAVACFLLAREVRDTDGPAAAVVVLLLLFRF